MACSGYPAAEAGIEMQHRWAASLPARGGGFQSPPAQTFDAGGDLPAPALGSAPTMVGLAPLPGLQSQRTPSLSCPCPFFPRTVANSAFPTYLPSTRGLQRPAFGAADPEPDAASGPSRQTDNKDMEMGRFGSPYLERGDQGAGTRAVGKWHCWWFTPGREIRDGRFCC